MNPWKTLEPHRHEARFCLAEVLAHLRRRAQRPVEVVTPGVVRAEHACKAATRRSIEELRAAMAADVVERAYLAILGPHNDDRVACEFFQEIIARRRDIHLATDAEPVPVKEAALFALEDFVRCVDGAGQCACRVQGAARPFQVPGNGTQHITIRRGRSRPGNFCCHDSSRRLARSARVRSSVGACFKCLATGDCTF